MGRTTLPRDAKFKRVQNHLRNDSSMQYLKSRQSKIKGKRRGEGTPDEQTQRPWGGAAPPHRVIAACLALQLLPRFLHLCSGINHSFRPELREKSMG